MQENIVFIQNDQQLNEKVFNSYISLIQNFLITHKAKLNDKIAVISENNLNTALLFHAITNAGYVFVPINPNYPVDLIKKLIDDTKINITLISGESSHINSLIEHSPSIIIEQMFEFINNNLNSKKNNQYLTIWRQVYYSTIIFTSGSSSKSPKGVVHSLNHHIKSANKSNANLFLNNKHRWLMTLPIHHISGIAILMRAKQVNATVVFQDMNLTIIENIKKYNVTHISLVASQLTDLLNNVKNIETLQKLDAVLIGGSAIPNSLIELAFNNNIKIYTSYGSTEFASQIATSSPNATLDQLKKSGKLLPNNKIKLNENKEILVKSDTQFYGYYNQSFDEDIENIIRIHNKDNQQYFHTNDIGQIDKNGYIDIIGRLDNMFITGGENIQPEEVEKQILKFDFITNCIVSPILDDKWGQRPVAFIELNLNNKNNFKEENFLDKLKSLLPNYSIPDLFLEWETDENNTSIKNNRKFYDELAQLKKYKILFKKNSHTE